MRNGYFKATKEAMSSPWWDEYYGMVKSVFTELCRKDSPNGIVEIHGTSPLFEETLEGSTNEYMVIFEFKRGFDKPEMRIEKA